MPIDNLLMTFVRVQRCKYRFHRLINSFFGKTAGWNRAPDVLGVVKSKISKLSDLPPLNPVDGAPDLNVLKSSAAKQMAVDLENSTDQDRYIDLADRAQYVASCDPGDMDAFELLLALFWLAHEETIAELKKIKSPYIVLHMTCVARLEKAEASVESFTTLDPVDYYQIKLIGNRSRHARFDAKTQTLEVPIDDGYSELSSKMFCAILLLSLSCNPSAIVKIDDDHRLNQVDALIKIVERVAHKRNPVQTGCLIWTPFPSAHNRAWHLGKSKTSYPVEMPTPLSFIKGGGGYVLNRGALWRLSWAAFYYKRWIKDILYEDTAIGETAEKLWIKKINCKFDDAIISVD